jgi:uncharacterized integral membrane protein
MMIFTLILALAFAVVAVIFAMGNTEPVTVSFLSWQITQSGALVIFGAGALGILIGILLMTPGAIKRNLALASHKKKLKGTVKELDEHKSKVSVFEEKEKAEERAKEEEIADVQKRLDEAMK